VGRDATLAANRFCLINLINSWTGVSDREEKLWVFGKASSFVQPLHVHMCCYSFVLAVRRVLRLVPYGTVGTHLKKDFFGWAIHSKERFTANFPEKIVSQTDQFGKTQNPQAT
jgi:hypothetical protein